MNVYIVVARSNNHGSYLKLVGTGGTTFFGRAEAREPSGVQEARIMRRARRSAILGNM